MARSQSGRLCEPGLFIFVVIPCTLIRFVLFPTFGFYRSYAKNHHSLITNHIELHNGTYPTALAAGEKIAANWGNFAFYWNFAVFIPGFSLLPPLNLPFMVVDTVVTVYLCIATNYQTGYSPHSKGRCNPERNAGFHDMLRPVGGNESFFEAAARLNSTVSTPRQMCESFVVEWQYGIAVSVFYALVSFLSIVAFFGAINEAKTQSKSTRDMLVGAAKGVVSCAMNIHRGIVLCVLFFLYWLPEALFRCLPLSWKAPVRYGRRHAVKGGLGLEQKAEMQMAELTTELKNARRRRTRKQYTGGAGTPTPLSEFLGIYDMLVLVTEQLHYLDMINLSRVSKSVREAVLPAQDFDRRMAVFKMYTCLATGKSTCWICSNQICLDCAQYPLIPQTTLLHHLDNCEPYCTPCFNTYILHRRPPRGQSFKDPYCHCAPVPAKPNLFNRWLKGNALYRDRQSTLPKNARAVCRECNMHSNEELLRIREKRTKAELKMGLRNTGEKWTRCTWPGCGRELGTGPRWWICRTDLCRKECSSWVHGAWGRGEKDKGKDGEVSVGYRAV